MFRHVHLHFSFIFRENGEAIVTSNHSLRYTFIIYSYMKFHANLEKFLLTEASKRGPAL